jgi:hypothetical protein
MVFSRWANLDDRWWAEIEYRNHGHRNLALTPEEGMLILDVVGGEIACVEVLDRKDVRRKLDDVLP